MSCISEVLYADIYFLHQTITFVASFLSGNCHGRRYLLVWYAGGERTPRRDLFRLERFIAENETQKWQILFCIVPLCQSICQFIW